MKGLSDPEIQLQLGLAEQAMRRRDPVAASHLIDGVLRSEPNCARAHVAKGAVFAAQNKLAPALQSFKSALRAEPVNPVALSWAALTALNLRQADEAEKFSRRLIGIHPRDARAHFVLTNALCIQDRLADALESIDHALAIQSEEPDFVVGKAQILGRLTWASQAIDWYRKALALRPSPTLAFELAASLIQEGLVSEAISVLEEWAPRVPPEDRPYPLMGQAYTEAQEFDRAQPIWDLAQTCPIERSELALIRINAEICAGRLAVAEELLREALEEDPGAARLYKPFASIKKITAADLPLIEQMEKVQAGGELTAEGRQDLAYALGKSYNDLGDFGKAIGHYDDANRIGFELSPVARKFDAGDWSAYTDFLIQFFTKERIASMVRLGLESATPLFVVGMIRSGTTLTEQILSRHPQINDGGEKTFWPDHRDEFLDPVHRRFDSNRARVLGENFLGMLSSHQLDATHVIEKNPSNFIVAAALHCIYPNSKFVHLKRHAVDNALSIWMTPLKTGLPFVHSRENIVTAFREYQRLAESLEQVLPRDRFQTFSYEALTRSPESTVAGMFKFLELPMEPECLIPEKNPRTVRTPSFFQVRQPINTASQDKWKTYEPWLGPFADLLAAASG